ncbi:hypothetical protein ACLKA6_019077 [Drosophila palustris]
MAADAANVLPLDVGPKSKVPQATVRLQFGCGNSKERKGKERKGVKTKPEALSLIEITSLDGAESLLVFGGELKGRWRGGEGEGSSLEPGVQMDDTCNQIGRAPLKAIVPQSRVERNSFHAEPGSCSYARENLCRCICWQSSSSGFQFESPALNLQLRQFLVLLGNKTKTN